MHTETDYVRVAKYFSSPHIHYSSSPVAITSGIASTGDFAIPSSGVSFIVFKVLRELGAIDQWYKDTFRYDPPFVTANWSSEGCRVGPGAQGTTMYLAHTHKFDHNGQPEPCEGTVTSITHPDTIAHEFAHIVFFDHYNLQNSRYPYSAINNPEGWHSPVHPDNSAGLAWIEGWAFFMTNAYSGTPTYQPSYMAGQWNFETRTHNEVNDVLFRDRPFVTGITGEGNVAAALYDAFDSTNEAGDDRQGQLANIWNTMTDSLESDEDIIAADFFEFKDDWDDSGHPSLDSIYTLNTMNPHTVSDDMLSDTFDNLDAWTEMGEPNWRIGMPDEGGHPPVHAAANMVAKADDCDLGCTIILTDGIDLTGHSSATLSMYRYVDDALDSGEYLKVDASSDGGMTWTNIFTWSGNADDDDTWHLESYDLAGYLTSTDFKVRVVAKASSISEDVMIDDFTIGPSDDGGDNGNGGGGGGSLDTTPPAITAPADVTAEATGALTVISIGQATATDTVDPDPAVTNDAPESFPLGDTTVTWTATDDSGNAATAAQTVTILDTTLPSITAPPDVTVEATGTLTAVPIGQATASDIADPAPAVTNDAPESFPLGDTTVTWVATDDSGNAATAAQTVTIRDTTPPRIAAPADHTAEAAGMMTVLNAGDYGTPTVSDIADPSPTITNDAPESFPLGNTTVTWTAADSSGNAVMAAQTITVQDTTPPAISGLRNISVDDPVGRGMAVSYDAPTAADLVDGAVAVSCTHESGSTFAPGFTEVSCTATDGSANSLRDWFIIHVDASDAILDVSQTVSTGRSTWSVTGPDRIFAGQTFEYTVTLEDGARPREEALAVYSAAPDTRYLGWHDPDADCQTILCAGFPEQKHNTYKIASDEDSPYTAMHNKMKKSRSSHTILLQPAADAPAGAQATVGMLDASYNPRGGIPVTMLPSSTKTIPDGDTTWSVKGPDRIFPGQTFEYTITIEEGPRHQHDALAIYSSSLTVDDFGGFEEGSGCSTTVCTDFPGQRRRTMELDNHAGSAYDVRYHTINAPGSQYTILLRTADDADAGGTFRVGVVDGDGIPIGGMRVMITDPVTVTGPYEELVAGLSFEGNLADATGDNNGTAATGDVTYVPGRIGRGLQLDNSSHVVLAEEADFDFGRSDPFSMAFWLRQDVPQTARSMILSKAESFGRPGAYVFVWDGAPNRVLLLLYGNSSFINVHTPQHLNMSDGAWRHIAFTYDGSGAKEGLNVYVDGEHRDYDHFRRGAGLTGNMTNDHAFTIGASGLGEYGISDAALDELRVYDTELLARQVRLLHAAGLG